MVVEVKPGVWKRRDGRPVTVGNRRTSGQWECSDGLLRFDDGSFLPGLIKEEDLVAFVSLPEQSQPQQQPDAAEELEKLQDRCDAINDDLSWMTNERDKWQTRAVQAEGRVKTLAQELATARQQLQDRDAADQVPGNEALRQQVTQLIAEREGLRRQLQMMERQIIGLSNTLADKQLKLDHAEQQRSILLETSQDQLGQIRMAERFASLMCDKIAQLAVERT